MGQNCEVLHSDELYRWLHPGQFKWSEGRASSAAFKGSHMSVDIAKLTTLKQSYERAQTNKKNAVVSFRAEEVFTRNQEVIHCPTTVISSTSHPACIVRTDCPAYSDTLSETSLTCINPAHGCVVGKKSDSFARALAKACKVEIYPPELLSE